MFKYTPLQQLANSKVVQNPLLTVNICERWQVVICIYMQSDMLALYKLDYYLLLLLLLLKAACFQLSDLSKHAFFKSCMQHVNSCTDNALFNTE